MSLRTKILLSICVVNVVVLMLLTLNIWVDAAETGRREVRRNAVFLSRLVTDALQDTLQEEQINWEKLSRQLQKSALFEGWVIAESRDGELQIRSSSHPDYHFQQLLKDEGGDLREALEKRRVLVQGDRAYVFLVSAQGENYAARFDLSPAGQSHAVTGLQDSLVRTLLVIGLGTALLLIVTYILLDRFVLRPLDSLVDASGRVSQGNFDTPIHDTAAYDEMARTVQAFNMMMQKIAMNQRNLEGEVREARGQIRNTEKRLFAAQRLSTTGTMAAGIAHEINNPLGGMLNAVRSLCKGKIDEAKSREYLLLIEEGLGRIKDIVAKVLQFSPKSLEPAPVELGPVVDRAIAFLEHRLKSREVTCVNKVPREGYQVQGDALELQQAILNILMNALDAINKGRGVINATVEQEGANLCLTVTDNGCGMSPEEIQRCLDPFFTTKEVGKGTGLGLSIANNIVTNHGGQLEIQSEPGTGTAILMRFPAL